MTTSTLSSVATRVVGHYGQVGKLLLGSYRTGARRLAKGANARYATFLDKRQLPLVNDDVKTSLIDIEKGVVALVEGRIVRGSDRAEQLIEALADSMSRGIERVAATTTRVEAAFDTKAISRVGGLSMPVAHASLELASRALEGTKRLTARVADGETKTIAVPAPVRRVAKKAVRRSKTRG